MGSVPNSDGQYDIFLSYSRADTEMMLRVKAGLAAQGLRIWIDQEQLEPSNPSWTRAIQRAIDACGCLVVVLSPSAKESEWVNEEMNYARTQDKRIFGVLGKGPAKRALPFGYSTLQYVDLTDASAFEDGVRQLVAAIDKHLARPPRPAATPINPDDLAQQMSDAYYAGDYADSVQLAQRLLALQPDHPAATDYHAKAKDKLAQGVGPDRRVPYEARIAYNRANSLVRAGDYEAAERLYRQAREIAQGAGITWREAETALLDLQDLALARELLHEGDRLLTTDDWAGALKKYEGVLRVVPHDPIAEERCRAVRSLQEHYYTLRTQLSQLSDTLIGSAHNLMEMQHMVATFRHALPSSPRLQQLLNTIDTRRQSIRRQLVFEGQTHLVVIRSAPMGDSNRAVLLSQTLELFQAALELDPTDQAATDGLQEAQRYASTTASKTRPLSQ